MVHVVAASNDVVLKSEKTILYKEYSSTVDKVLQYSSPCTVALYYSSKIYTEYVY